MALFWKLIKKNIKYWVGFSLRPGIGRVRFSQLENYFQNLENAWKATPAELKQAGLDSGSTDRNERDYTTI
jgi:predicted Rossmann fold nucleotide-binding protein DprA/Smf involved in DNA uptake